ncbi:hypothetical protein Sjap_016588 [Stephania japonica]|uniref:Uncharacterized protein n=1 Tax=Stephania japonica TaxID=461633 RepID=A0AAP0NV44_9MAGN
MECHELIWRFVLDTGSLDIHLSGLNCKQSFPHISSILPTACKEMKILVLGWISWPLGRMSCFIGALRSNGTDGKSRRHSHKAP